MNLRLRLALALAVAALLPMAVMAAIQALGATRRAEEQTAGRLDRARRQAAILVERETADVRARVAQAAADLGRDRGAARALQQGPASAARALARGLAGRYRLDDVEVRDERGALLAASGPAETSALPIDALALADNGVAMVPPAALPPPRFEEEGGEVDGHGAGDGTGPGGGAGELDGGVSDAGGGIAAGAGPAASPGLVSRRTVSLGGETYLLLGCRRLGRPFLEMVAAITGGPVDLLTPRGEVALEARGAAAAERGAAAAGGARGGDEPGPAAGAVPRATADVPILPGGYAVRVSVEAADARRVRRDLAAALGGVAPLAIAGALLVGLLLAEGIARPVRALWGRAERIAAERSGPLTPSRQSDEVRGLTAAFDRMIEALTESETRLVAAERVAAWQEAARRVAHEVRNALSPIRLAVENLRRTRDRTPDRLAPAIEVETGVILEEVDSLRRLVEEFSLFARMPAPRCALCDLRAAVAKALGLLAPRLEGLGVEVAIDDEGAPHVVRADDDMVGRALKNVLSNALDAMESAPERRLSILLRRVPGAAAEFEEIVVRDTGAGFSADALRRVFEPYFTTRAGSGGTGLGMAIVYRIAAEHGGAVSVSSGGAGSATTGGAAHGATVTLRLPIDGPREAAGVPGDAASGPRDEEGAGHGADSRPAAPRAGAL